MLAFKILEHWECECGNGNYLIEPDKECFLSLLEFFQQLPSAEKSFRDRPDENDEANMLYEQRPTGLNEKEQEWVAVRSTTQALKDYGIIRSQEHTFIWKKGSDRFYEGTNIPDSFQCEMKARDMKDGSQEFIVSIMTSDHLRLDQLFGAAEARKLVGILNGIRG